VSAESDGRPCRLLCLIHVEWLSAGGDDQLAGDLTRP
jgi:hypothetical protein